MPYASKKQAAYVHAEADRGTGWAKKFVSDAHGSHVGEGEKKRSFKGTRKGGVHHPFPKRAAGG
jgi:hypothetical protein